jgi:TetR/AcrR family transcriptional regulator of autoinduction and epiphytic fitness
MVTAAGTTTRPDGRAARRERGRQAVVDAALDVLLETGRAPSPEAVVRRAGVSLSSLFRYVDGLAELQLAAIERFLERYSHLFELPEVRGCPLAERVTKLVAARWTLYTTVAPVGRIVRARAADNSVLAEALHSMRHRQIVQVRDYFAPELQTRSTTSADDVVHTIVAITSFEAWDMQCSDAGRSPVQIQRAWRTAITTLLS